MLETKDALTRFAVPAREFFKVDDEMTDAAITAIRYCDYCWSKFRKKDKVLGLLLYVRDIGEFDREIHVCEKCLVKYLSRLRKEKRKKVQSCS